MWRSLLDMGVDGVMTARPKAFAALLRKRGDGQKLHGKPPTVPPTRTGRPRSCVVAARSRGVLETRSAPPEPR